MNLLDATTTLLDIARSNSHENDRIAKQAIRRVEQRLQVLKIRAAKSRRRCRHNAWWDMMWTYVGAYLGKLAVIDCPQCKTSINFGQFASTAQISGSGSVRSFACPVCNKDLGHGVTRHPDRPFR